MRLRQNDSVQFPHVAALGLELSVNVLFDLPARVHVG